MAEEVYIFYFLTSSLDVREWFVENLVGKPEKKRTLGKPRLKWEVKFSMCASRRQIGE